MAETTTPLPERLTVNAANPLVLQEEGNEAVGAQATCKSAALASAILRRFNGHLALVAALRAVMACPTLHDENGHAYIRVDARSINGTAALVSAALRDADAPRA